MATSLMPIWVIRRLKNQGEIATAYFCNSLLLCITIVRSQGFQFGKFAKNYTADLSRKVTACPHFDQIII